MSIPASRSEHERKHTTPLTPKLFTLLCSLLAAVLICVMGGMWAAQVWSARDFVFGASKIAVITVAVVLIYRIGIARTKEQPPERAPLYHSLLGNLGMIVLFAGFGIIMFDSVIAGIVQYWWIPAMSIGGVVIATGWKHRVGNSLHCPQCEYEFASENADDKEAPIRCPECGTGWLGRLKRGRRQRSSRRVGIGVALIILPLLMSGPWLTAGPIGRTLPTPVLYAVLYAAPGKGFFAWDELATRKLSPWWTGVMAERVLAARNAGTTDRIGAKWLETQIAAGALPTETSERFYREGFQADLIAPSRAKVGEEFEVKLRVRRAAGGFGTQLGIYFAGYAVGDGPLIGRQEKTVWAHALDPQILTRQRIVLRVKVRGETTGQATVRAVFWVMYAPSFWENLSWQPDGTPAKPATALWFERIELTRTMRIH